MPRLFYPPLVEPGVLIKPKGTKKKTLKSDDVKVFLHSFELLVEISGIEPLTS